MIKTVMSLHDSHVNVRRFEDSKETYSYFI